MIFGGIIILMSINDLLTTGSHLNLDKDLDAASVNLLNVSIDN